MLMPALFGENLIDDFFKDFEGFPFYDDTQRAGRRPKQSYASKTDKLMRTDIKETKDGYILITDLPGFKKEDIQVSIEDGCLTIFAQKTEDDENERYLRRERYCGMLQRSFYVGENITREDIKAQFKHGVLRLSIPKKKPVEQTEQSKYITIE